MTDVSICVTPCSSTEGRPFRLGTGANMEKVVKMDRDMTKVSSGLVWMFWGAESSAG